MMAKREATSNTGLALKLYIALGIVIFISIAYTIVNKPVKAPPTETAAAAAPAQPPATAKEKTDLDETKVAETNVAQNPTA